MMRPNVRRRSAIRGAAAAASCIVALVGALSFTGRAGQLRSVTDGVYSTAQAARGQQVYQTQCTECHGPAMEGGSGPPLSGENFLSNWSAQPLANLVEKIQKTMPFTLPGTLSREQSIDLTAYILQVGKFPAGQNELGAAALSQVAFATAATRTPAPVASSTGAGLPAP